MLPFPVCLNGFSFSATLDNDLIASYVSQAVSVLGVIGISSLRALLLDLNFALADGPSRSQMQLTAADFFT
jgi:hypothetical protein